MILWSELGAHLERTGEVALTHREARGRGELPPRTIERLLVGALVLLAAVHVGTLAYHLVHTIQFPYDLDYGEGYVLNDAARLARGEAIYRDIQLFPMVRSPYPPLFPWLWSRAIVLGGPAFWQGRLLATMALVGAGILVAGNAWRARAVWWVGLVAVALLLGSPFVYQWAGYSRVDTLALFFSIAGVLAAQWMRGRRGAFVAGGCCLAAVWTKQSALAAPAAVMLALMAQDRRRAALFALTLGAPSALALAALQAATGGEFARHVLEGNARNPFNPARMALLVIPFAVLHVLALSAAVHWASRALRGVPSPVALYALLALASVAAIGNEGSSVNYFLEPVAGMALALPFALRSATGSAARLAPMLAVAQLAMLLHWPNGWGTDLLSVAPHGRTPDEQDLQVGARLDTAVRGASGAVLSEAAGFSVRANLPVYIQPIDLRAEQRLGRWNSKPLVDALAGGQFPLLITVYDLLPADAEQALRRYFSLADTIPSDDGLVYRLYRYSG